MINIDFVRFNATDNVELQGWINNEKGDIAVIHIHGMSGNGYENYFLDDLRLIYAKNGISLFTIDTRGRGIISDYRQNEGWKHAGSCFEIFDESVHDIQGAINYLKSIGKTRIILQGHSLGCTKTVNFIVTQNISNIEKVILLAPTDMAGWASKDPNHDMYLRKAHRLNSQNKGQELVNAEIWLDKTPISAQTYPTVCETGSSADIYCDRDNGALLGRINLPMIIIYGTADIGITEVDGTIEHWMERVKKIKNKNTQCAIINGAQHGFRGYEKELAKIVGTYIAKN